MKDLYGREIDYIRISITDRCSLRCRYCMPDGPERVCHEDILRYEEILRLCRIFADCGIRHYKVTGGEPFMRRGATEFMRQLKALPGVETVTVTTNAVALEQEAEKLAEAGIDGVNISLDAADAKRYAEIAGRDMYEQVRRGIRASVDAGLKTKLNCVLLADTGDQLKGLAAYAKDDAIDVRFIELMPIGAGQAGGGLSPETARNILLEEYPDLHRIEEKRGFGPAYYEASRALQGRIGWISAVSHKFCESCNRVRLTSTGTLKPCLCYGECTDLRALLRGGADDAQIKEVFEQAVKHKPMEHCFSNMEEITEHQSMAQIGG